MRVDGSLRSLLQGVSQQPARDRLSGQATAQFNMSSDPVTGLTRRPSTDLVEALLTSSTVKQWFNFQTKNGNKFVAAIDNNAIKVWDFNGNAKTCTNSAAANTYLGTGTRYCSGVVNDTLYIADKDKSPAMLTGTKTYYNRQTSLWAGMLFFSGADYGAELHVSVNGTEVGYVKIPGGSAGGQEQYIGTTDVALRIATMLKAVAGTVAYGSFGSMVSQGSLTGSQWVVTQVNNYVLITNTTGTQFTLTIDDGRGNTLSKAFTDSVKDAVDLPPRAPYGYAVRVAKHTDPQKDLWLEFILKDGTTTLGSGFGKDGYWQEVVADNTPYQLNNATMPLKLVYTSGTDSFACDLGTWQDRRAGTTTSNEDPSFVGNTINDIFTFQSRLGFAAGPNIIMSRTDHHDDFWIGSVQAQADTDPIDITSTAVEASIMTAVVPNNKDLIIFSREGQFLISGRSAITPANAALTLTTAFEAELNAHPAVGGANVYFANNFGMFTGMREFYAEGNADLNNSQSITQHVNKYMNGKATKITSSSNYNMLVVQTDADPSTVYPYQYIWNGQQKIQSAWSTWKFNRNIVHSFFDEELLYLVVVKSNKYCLYRMSLDVQPTNGIEYHCYMDGRFDVPNCFTSFILPDTTQHDETIIAVQGTGCPNPGLRAEIQSIALVGSDWVVTLKKSMAGGTLLVGSNFLSYYKPTMPFVKDSDNVVIGTGKLRVRDFLVTVVETGGMISQTLSKWGDQDEVEFTARQVGDVENLVGHQPLADTTFVCPFREDTNKAELYLASRAHLPLTIVDIEWVGQYNKRGRRISLGGAQGNTNIGAAN